MRIFIYLLSFLILSLAVMPCTDTFQDEHAINDLRHNHSHDDKDSCSPFCICACCGIAGIYNTSFSFDFAYTFMYMEKPTSHYTSEYVSSFFNAIWQPPKLA